MKNLMLALALFLTIAGTSYAQSTFGIKGGVNFSGLAIDEEQIDDASTKAGFTFGIVNRNNFDGIGFQTELLYTRKGSEYELGNTIVDANLDYLELPITLQVRLFDTPLSIYAGGYASYLMNVNYEYKINGEDDGDIVEYDEKDNFNRFDFGLLGGLSFDIGRLTIDGRFTRGLINVEDEDKVINNIPFIANDTKNFGFQLTAGLNF